LQAYKQGLRGVNDADVYAKQMAPFVATLPDDAAIRNVVAYIATLTEQRPPSTVTGNPARGKVLYTTCVSCHGKDGEGVWSTNAPRLSNMSDWYLQRQLQHFRSGVRGAHPQDFNGAQMASMARVLKDDQAIDDLLDYVHQL